jgi:hypothetical protein
MEEWRLMTHLHDEVINRVTGGAWTRFPGALSFLDAQDGSRCAYRNCRGFDIDPAMPWLAIDGWHDLRDDHQSALAIGYRQRAERWHLRGKF